MERPQFYSPPASLASSRSSFESRYKSPLSISSSIDFQSSRTSAGSTFSNADARSAYFPSPTSGPYNFGPGAKRSFTEPIVPARRYGHGAHGTPQVYTTLITPQRLSRGPMSPTSPVSREFGVRYKPRVPGEGFKKLPEEILLVILGELKKLHLEVGCLSCATCWMRDLVNLGLSCQKWWSAARFALYEDIKLRGIDSVLHTKKYKIRYGVRLKLLRRTLRARPDYAAYVKSLTVPSMPAGLKGKKEQEEYIDLVASLIMVCPNLERLPGFYPAYNHTFSRFAHALSTRPNLKEVVWVINPSPSQRQHRYTSLDDAQYFDPLLAPAALLPEQCVDFLTYHSNWTQLRTLVLHSNPGGTIDSLLFADICNHVPSIENLHVSSFPTPAFNDSTLISLPPLKSLRLEDLSGITPTGLSNYACLASSNTLTSLSLVSLPLLSLPVLARLFSYLKSLTRFTLSQAPAPGLPIGTEIYLHPYLVSPSLEYLHWEITDPDNDRASDILAKSILYSGFPSLRTIRVPTDFNGTFQNLCRPRGRIEVPIYRNRDIGNGDMTPSKSLPSMSPPSSAWSTITSPVSPSFLMSPRRSSFSVTLPPPTCIDDDPETKKRGMSLHVARRMAQNRIDASQNMTNFHIIIWDEDSKPLERHQVGGFIGTIQSKISYSLRPDIEGADEAVVSMEGPCGLLDESEETNVRDGCTGTWNQQLGSYGKSSKNSSAAKDRWWHTERGRRREVNLDKFFR
jgi:hypothetical protein